MEFNVTDLENLSREYKEFETSHNKRATTKGKLTEMDYKKALEDISPDNYFDTYKHTNGKVTNRYNISRHLTDTELKGTRDVELKPKDAIRRTVFKKRLLFINALIINHMVDNPQAFVEEFKRLNSLRKSYTKLTDVDKVKFYEDLEKFSSELITKSKDDLSKYGTSKNELKNAIKTKIEKLSSRPKKEVDKIEKATEEAKKPLKTKLKKTKQQLDIAEAGNEVQGEDLDKLQKDIKDKDDLISGLQEELKKQKTTNVQKFKDLEKTRQQIENRNKRDLALLTGKEVERGKTIEEVSKNQQEALTKLSNNNKTAIIATGGIGAIGALGLSALPYVPKLLKLVTGVGMKKRKTVNELINDKVAGVDLRQQEDDRRSIDNLKRQIDNLNYTNRQKTINRYSIIGQQNKLNRVVVNNIRGRTIHNKNKIKMHNITKRKIFNI